MQPGNGEGLFLFWRFINLSLTYVLRRLPSYMQPWNPHEASSHTTVPSNDHYPGCMGLPIESFSADIHTSDALKCFGLS